LIEATGTASQDMRSGREEKKRKGRERPVKRCTRKAKSERTHYMESKHDRKDLKKGEASIGEGARKPRAT
jgi:hypothetical protein